jgi:signal transduction histidine kinase
MSIMHSLRFRITALAMVVVVAVLGATGFFLVRAVEDHVVGQVDHDLTSNAQYIQYRMFHNEFIAGAMPGGEFAQVYTTKGQLLGQSANLVGRRPIVSFRGPAVQSPTFVTKTAPKLGTVRVLEYPLGGQRVLTLVEGQQINQAMAVSSSLAHLLWIVLPLLALLLSVLIWQVVGRAMRRVEAVRSSVAHITANNLDERVQPSGSGDELDHLVTTMNQMLDRLKVAVEREHQFVADASHELRSPMTALRAALTGADPNAARANSRLEAALSSLQRLELLAEELLAFEADGAKTSESARHVDLDDLVLSQASYLRATSGLTIDVSEVSGGQVVASEMDMARVIENLSSNAVRHATSTVKFGLVEGDEVVRLTVADDGPGVPEEMRLKIFERFFRIDSDRNRARGGAGLGLAIAADLARRWDGRISVATADPSGALFVVELPRAPAAVSTMGRELDQPEFDHMIPRAVAMARSS